MSEIEDVVIVLILSLSVYYVVMNLDMRELLVMILSPFILLFIGVAFCLVMVVSSLIIFVSWVESILPKKKRL